MHLLSCANLYEGNRVSTIDTVAKENDMGLVKTRRLAAMEKQQTRFAALVSRIDADDILRKRFGEYFAVGKYKRLLKGVANGEIGTEDFQHDFNHFCMVRKDKKWRAVFYELFAELAKRRSRVAFGDVLLELDKRLKRKLHSESLEVSFSSKMLAFLRPNDFPIWDSRVVNYLRIKEGVDLTLKVKGPLERREEEALRNFDALTKWVKNALNTKEVMAALKRFDNYFPKEAVKGISPIKKLDWLLWADGGYERRRECQSLATRFE